MAAVSTTKGPLVADQDSAALPAETGAARLQAMVAGLNAIVWERDPRTLAIRFINARAVELLGYPTEQWLTDSTLSDRILHPDDRAAALARADRALAEDDNYSMSYRVRAADGSWRWLQHHGHVVRDRTGTPTALHAVLIDVTESKRREEAAALLAEAGRVLADPGPVTERLAEAAELTCPALGDRATVWLRADDGRYRPVAAAPAGSAPQVLALPPVSAPPELELAYRVGRPFVVPEVTEELLRVTASGDDAHIEELAALGAHAVLVVPLRAAGQVVGLLSLDAVDPGRWTEDDLGLAAELGQRIAVMVAAERVAGRQRRLTEVTVALSAAGTVAEAAAELAAGLRRLLGATTVGVRRLGPDGLLHLVHDLGYPTDQADRFRTVRLGAAFPVADAARTGRPVWLPDLAAWQDKYPEAVPYLLEQANASVALPLSVGGRVLGTVTATFPTSRLFEPDERAFVLHLTDQAAAAFERAALADARRTMAETLQRSLLPGELPLVDRLAVAARYLPAVAGTQAGGDWFDVLALSGGRVALVVGDVVGDGAPAAAVMGQLRSALAAVLLAGFRPGRALEVLDRFAAEVAGARVSTVACLQLDPATGRLTYSSAGHPPSLLLTDGGADYLDGGHGPALGLPTRGRRPEAAITLPVGGTLLLYTDGLVERRGATLDDGLARLAATADERRLDAPSTLLDRLLQELVDGGASDDIALVAVRRLPAPLRLDLPAVPAQLRGLRRAVQRWAEEASLPAEATGDLQLALGEAAANAIEHAYQDDERRGRVVVAVDPAADGSLAVTVSDTGTWRPPADDPGFRGRGLQMISALAADVDLTHGPAGTLLRFRIQPPVPPPVIPRPRAGGAPAVAGAQATLTVSEVGGRRCLQLSGDLDLAGVAAVRDAVLAQLDDRRPVTLDLTGLGFVASVGAGLLLQLVEAARTDGDLDVVLPAAGPARRLLDLTGLTGMLRTRGGPLPR
jgi:anti-anti-sigma factor